MTLFLESGLMVRTVNTNTMMTTEEITLLLAAAERRMAEIEPQKKELYSKFQALEKQVAELSKPMETAREAWHVLYSEFEALKIVRTLYTAELAKSEGVAA